MSKTSVYMLKTIRSSLGGTDFSTETLKNYLTIKTSIITTKIQTLLQQLGSSVSSISFTPSNTLVEKLPSLPTYSDEQDNMLMKNVNQHIDKISQEFDIPTGPDSSNILNRYPQILGSLLSLASMLSNNEAEPITEVVKEALQPFYQKIYAFHNSISTILDQQSALHYQQQVDQLQLMMALRQEQVAHERALSTKLEQVHGELQGYQQSIQQSAMHITASIVEQNRQFQQGFQSLVNWESKSTEMLIRYQNLSEKEFQAHLCSLTEKATVQAKKPGISFISGSDRLIIANQLKPNFALNAQNFHMHPVFTNINYLYYYLIQFCKYPYESELANPSHWQSVANTVLKLIEKKWQQKNPLNEKDENINREQLLEIINTGKDLLKFMLKSQEFLAILCGDLLGFGENLLQRCQEIQQEALLNEQTNFLQKVKLGLEEEIQVLHNMPMPVFNNKLYARLNTLKYMPPTKEVGPNIVYKKYGFLFRNLRSFSPESMEAYKFDSSHFIKEKDEQARIIINKCIEYLKGKIQILPRKLPPSSHIIYPELGITEEFTTPLFVPDKGFPIPAEFAELDKKRRGKVTYSYHVDHNANALTINAFYQDLKGEEYKIASFKTVLEEFNELDNDKLFDYWYGGRYAKKDDTIVFYYQADSNTLEAEEGLSPHGTDIVYFEDESNDKQEDLEEYQTVSTHSVSLNKHIWDNYPPCNPYPENRNRFTECASATLLKPEEIQTIVSHENQLWNQQKSEQLIESTKALIEQLFKDSKASRLIEKLNCILYVFKALGILLYNEKTFTEKSFFIMSMHPFTKKHFFNTLCMEPHNKNILEDILSKKLRIFSNFMNECAHLPKPFCALIQKPLDQLEEIYECYQKNLSELNYADPNDEITQLRLENTLLKEQIAKQAHHHHHPSASSTQALTTTLKKTHRRSYSQ